MSARNGGLAFPAEGPSAGQFDNPGMTLRDYFAAKADVAVYRPSESFELAAGRAPTIKELAEYIAQIRAAEADAMLAAREGGES